jgi:arylsulfatase A-like enzyme
MIEAMDTGLGRVFAALEKAGLREKTLIVFTSDNGAQFGALGGPGSERTDRFHGPYSGNKDTVWEQGIRVPAIAAWPGTLPAGKTFSVPVHGCDWLPTFFARTGALAPAGSRPLDGRDVLPLLRGEPAGDLALRLLPFQKNRYTPVAHSNASIRRGPWKLLWPGIPETIRKDSLREHFFNYLRDSFDTLYAEGNPSGLDRPKMMSVGMHCRLLGRPGRIGALRRFLDHVQSHEQVWICRRIDIARHWKTEHPFDAATAFAWSRA